MTENDYPGVGETPEIENTSCEAETPTVCESDPCDNQSFDEDGPEAHKHRNSKYERGKKPAFTPLVPSEFRCPGCGVKCANISSFEVHTRFCPVLTTKRAKNVNQGMPGGR